MNTLSLAAVICLIFITGGTDGDCKVGEETYKVGEDWKEENKCIGHTCLEDGTYDTKKCQPVPDPLPEHWTVTPESLVAPNFPSCCAQANPPIYDYSLPGCKEGNQTVKVGEQVNDLGSCYLKVCKGNGEWAIASCGLAAIPEGWDNVPDDHSKNFPECCGHGVPPHNISEDLGVKIGAYELTVTYKGDLKASAGNELTPTQVKEQPEVSYMANPETHYILIMTDPDAPSRQKPELREFLHWQVGNIPGHNISSGETLAEYIGSGPPKDTGLHRYVFLLYKQPGKLNFDEPRVNNTSTVGRPKFSTSKFAEKYKLEGPIAFRMYQAQYDDYVPVLHKQLGFA